MSERAERLSVDSSAAAARPLRLLARMALAFGAGAAGVLGMAPFNLWPLLLLALATFFRLMDGAIAGPKPLRAAFWTGWAFGFGYMAVGLYWIGEAFFVDPATIWMMPFAVTLLPAGMALYFGAAGWLAGATGARGAAGALVLTASVCLLEFVRGFLFTGFPWNLFGSALIDSSAAQGAALIGVYGLTFVIALAGFGLGAATLRGPLRFAPLAAGAALLIGLFVYGLIRPDPLPATEAFQIRIVQPDNPQSEKGERDYAARLWRRLASLTAAEGAEQVDIVLWPEGVTPFFLDETPEALSAIGDMLHPGEMLIAGSSRRVVEDGGRRYYNSLFVIDEAGAIVDGYDKAHLVPFGEFLPLPGFFKSLGIASLTARVGGAFSAGPGLRTIETQGVPPFSALICYEALFPGEVVAGGTRPRWLVNITDDSWFGTQIGPHQHLATARFRAIEEGLPLARAATTGISAMVDARGRIVASSALQTAAFFDVALPPADAPTVFSGVAHAPFLVLIALAAAAGIAASSAPRRRGKSQGG